MHYKEKETRRGERGGGVKAENGEQLCLVGATRPADVFRQRYPAEGGEDVTVGG